MQKPRRARAIALARTAERTTLTLAGGVLFLLSLGLCLFTL